MIIVFVHIPKTAGTTFKFILRNTFGLAHCETNMTRQKLFDAAQLRTAKRIFPGLKSLAGHNLIEPVRHLAGEDLVLITFLRDPVVRVISAYQDYHLRGGDRKTVIPLERCVRNNPGFRNLQVKMIAGEEDVEKAKRILKEQFAFVGFTEKFDESLQLLDRICPVKLNLQYHKSVVARSNQIKNSLLKNTWAVDLLTENNRLDIELYNYIKEELYPYYKRQAEAQGPLRDITYNSYQREAGLRFLLSKWYNKYVFRQLMKVKKSNWKSS